MSFDRLTGPSVVRLGAGGAPTCGGARPELTGPGRYNVAQALEWQGDPSVFPPRHFLTTAALPGTARPLRSADPGATSSHLVRRTDLSRAALRGRADNPSKCPAHQVLWSSLTLAASPAGETVWCMRLFGEDPRLLQFVARTAYSLWLN